VKATQRPVSCSRADNSIGKVVEGIVPHHETHVVTYSVSRCLNIKIKGSGSRSRTNSVMLDVSGGGGGDGD
jgi:hypothetical protein